MSINILCEVSQALFHLRNKVRNARTAEIFLATLHYSHTIRFLKGFLNFYIIKERVINKEGFTIHHCPLLG